MSDYTPTTEDVREDYTIGRNEVIGAGWYSQHRAEFDSWLAAHDAEKRAEWEAEQEDLDNCCDVRGGQDRCGDCPKDRGSRHHQQRERGRVMSDEELLETYRASVNKAMDEASARDGFATNMSRESIVAGLRAVFDMSKGEKRAEDERETLEQAIGYELVPLSIRNHPEIRYGYGTAEDRDGLVDRIIASDFRKEPRPITDEMVEAAAREYHERGNGEGSFARTSGHVRTSLLFRMKCALRAAEEARR